MIVVLAGLVLGQWVRTAGRNRSRVPSHCAGGARRPACICPARRAGRSSRPSARPCCSSRSSLPPQGRGGQHHGLFNFWLFVLGLVVTLIAVIGWLRDAMREWRPHRSSPRTRTRRPCRRARARRSRWHRASVVHRPRARRVRSRARRARAGTTQAGRATTGRPHARAQPVAVLRAHRADGHALRHHLQCRAHRRRPDPGAHRRRRLVPRRRPRVRHDRGVGHAVPRHARPASRSGRAGSCPSTAPSSCSRS